MLAAFGIYIVLHFMLTILNLHLVVAIVIALFLLFPNVCIAFVAICAALRFYILVCLLNFIIMQMQIDSVVFGFGLGSCCCFFVIG